MKGDTKFIFYESIILRGLSNQKDLIKSQLANMKYNV